MIATGGYFPLIVGILFIVGLISSAYATAGSALTALTTSFTIDILGVEGKSENEVRRFRKRVHFGMAIVMGVVIFIFGILNNKTVIDAVYTLAGYTYGPILGMFAFGILMKKQVRDRYIPIVAVLSPILCYVIQHNSERWFNGYQFSYELLLINALFTFMGFWALSGKDRKIVRL
jgi:Na+/proline symporter